MRGPIRLVLSAVAAGLFAACDSAPVEEYPSAEEVPVTEPAATQPGGRTTGVDTVLDPILPPPPGTTPP